MKTFVCLAVAAALGAGDVKPSDGAFVRGVEPAAEIAVDASSKPLFLFASDEFGEAALRCTRAFRKARRFDIPAELHLGCGDCAGREREFVRQLAVARAVGGGCASDTFASDADCAQHVVERLWPEGRMPDCQTNQCVPVLAWHLPKVRRTEAVQIICHGGGYKECTASWEVEPVRRYLNSIGIPVVTLRYRVPRPAGLPKHLTAWQDLQRCIRLVRAGAADKGLDPSRIGLMGFSAGGHLTLLGAFSSRTNAYRPVDAVDRLPCNVQWAVAVYPAYALTDGADEPNVTRGTDDGARTVPELAFDADTCPTLFLHGTRDRWASMNSVKCWERLRAMGVSSELHTFATRGHCFQCGSVAGTGAFNWLDRVRDFVSRDGIMGAAVGAGKGFPKLSPPRAITGGPHEHLLANYFAINAWSTDLRHVAVLETDINGRLAGAGERVTIGLVDTQDGNRFIPVTTTACWNFQEAAMLHWLPNEPDTFVFNDCRDGRFVAVVMNWKTKAERIVPFPVSAVSQDGTRALSLNYARLFLTRPDYGYAGDGQDARAATVWPEDDGLWLVDLRTGKGKLILSVAQARALMPKMSAPKPPYPNGLAYYCHTVFNPSADRIFFLARTVDWFDGATHEIPPWLTTSFTVRTDGTDLRRCFRNDTWGGSHFNWLDDRTMAVTVWPTGANGRRYGRHVKFTVGEEDRVRVLAPGLLDWDGHCVWSPDGKWLSTEGYYDNDFNRPWALMRTEDEAVKSVGSFFVPEKYRATYWRCDLHARWRPDGRQLAFNSVHEGSRQVYVIDVVPEGER